MQLIGSFTSPFVRKVRVALAEHGIDFDFVEETPYTPDTSVTQYNPLVKVPCLVDDNGEHWFDSSLILAMLETVSGKSLLLPEDMSAQLKVRRLEILADGIGDAGVLIFMEMKRDAAERSTAWIERQQQKVDNGLTWFDQFAGQRAAAEFLTDVNGSPALTTADIALVCVLEWYTLRFGGDWHSRYQHLAALAEKTGSRDSFVNTRPPV